MAQTERLYKLRHWLDGGGCLRPAWAERELEVSKSTLKRDIQHLRERLGMPIDSDADAWCHQRQALRSFSVDAIEQVRVLAHPAIDIDDAELDAVLGAGYGNFAGRQLQRARLRFAPERARWVAAEIWHPAQHGRWDAEGRWLLDLPYADPRELVMDILRHVPDVEVLAPQELEDEVRRRLQAGLRQMGSLAGDLDE